MVLIKQLIRHAFVLVALLASAIAIAIWRGELYPIDLRFSVLIVAGGLAILALAWAPAWLLLLALSALLNRFWQRLVLWPVCVLGMILLHAVLGHSRGFLPIGVLWPLAAIHLYAIPVAISLLFGSLLRQTIRCITSKRS